MGWLIQQLKGMKNLPVAVITYGSLLYLAQERQGLTAADAVSLEAGTAELYRQINRPNPEVTFTRVVEGLVAAIPARAPSGALVAGSLPTPKKAA
jgi:wyosine [tRNA(Phe)-imidazoG37] synthetase (radical SAM superfamily)